MDMDNSNGQHSGHSRQVNKSKENPSSPQRVGTGSSDNNRKQNQQHLFHPVDVPADNTCLFWAVTLAYLIPVKNNHELFLERYNTLFGNEEIASKSLKIVRTSIQNYNPLCDRVPDTNRFLRYLIREAFRNRVVDYILANRSKFEEILEGDFDKHLDNMRNFCTWGGEAEITAISEILNARVVVSGATESQYGNNSNNYIQLYHVDLSQTGGSKNHYNFGLKQRMISDYQKILNDDILRKLNKYYRSCDINDFVDNSISNIDNNNTPLQRETIEDIAKIKVLGQSNVIFKITSLEDVNQELLSQFLAELARAIIPRNQFISRNHFLAIVIDLGDMHWVTLVINYENEQFHGYYVDSLGGKLPKVIENAWGQSNNGQNPNIHDYTIIEKQRTDQNNTGMFAFKDAEYIIQKLQSGNVELVQNDFGEARYYCASSLIEDRRHLAEMLEEKGKMKDNMKEDVLQASRKIIRAHNKFGDFLKLTPSQKESIPIAQETIKTYEEIHKFQTNNLGEDHEYTLNTLSTIAFTNNKLAGIKSQNNPEEAIRHYEEASIHYKKVHQFKNRSLGKEHEETLNTLSDIAYTCNKLGRLKFNNNSLQASEHYQEAYNILKEVFEIQSKILGKIHEKTLNSLNDIAYTCNSLGEIASLDGPEGALTCYKQALNVYKEVYDLQNDNLGKEHQHTVKALRDIMFTNTRLGRLQVEDNPTEALKYYEEGLKIATEVLELDTKRRGRGHYKTKYAEKSINLINFWINKLNGVLQ